MSSHHETGPVHDQRSRREILHDRVEEAAIRFLVRRADAILNRVPIEWEPDAQRSYIEARQEGYVPLTISSHQIHLDGLGLAHVNKALRELEIGNVEYPLQGHKFVLAKSILTGHQGKLLQVGFNEMIPIFNRLGTQAIARVRPEDVERYGMVGNSLEVQDKLRTALKNNYGIAAFPEGNVQAGRKKPKEYQTLEEMLSVEEIVKGAMEDWGILDSEIHGMQRFDGNTINGFKRLIQVRGKKAALTSMAIDGVYRLIRPNNDHTTSVTPRGYIAAVTPFDLGMVRIKVGVTERIDDIEAELGEEYEPQDIGDYMGRKVAQLLPPEKRGVYRAA